MADKLKNTQMEHWQNDNDKGKLQYLKKTVPVPHCPTQIQQGLAWRNLDI
jgi:hypothetical protein